MPKRVNKYKQDSLKRMENDGATSSGKGKTPTKRKRFLFVIKLLRYSINFLCFKLDLADFCLHLVT